MTKLEDLKAAYDAANAAYTAASAAWDAAWDAAYAARAAKLKYQEEKENDLALPTNETHRDL